eukprot:CAMPEP_0175380538 /NCGR_PEP_ID=MMETSP0095-20121207/26369_1 /TAXON_ID=311494 /ORGANISM="Alexandrium monilatum, Strain CCMP3105" /LENGTH=625 /DNA_ID=CAMNT_0016678909 /DNA_START=30 /DNA_END=1907 /DNA_ORIENTATION=+
MAAEEPVHLKRWMRHVRPDTVPDTLLRSRPTEERDFNGHSAKQHEVVEVISPSEGSRDGFALVRPTRSGGKGWVRAKHLKDCPEALGQMRRWMLHVRGDGVADTLLRSRPSEAKDWNGHSAWQHEVVEVVDPSAGPKDGFVHVRLALDGAEGWVRSKLLKECPEGTEDQGTHSVNIVDLPSGTKRFTEVSERVREASGGRFAARGVRFITGHFLGETGLEGGAKESLFYGAEADEADAIARGGFGDQHFKVGRFGRGLSFSPEAVTAYRNGQVLLICEVALGSQGQRVKATGAATKHTSESLQQAGKCSVQSHRDGLGGREERIVYRRAQCKPVYLVKVEVLADELPRWMEHQRTDSESQSPLLERPDGCAAQLGSAGALNKEVVEVLEGPNGSRELTDGYAFVRLSVGGQRGWLRGCHLQQCPEGTDEHGYVCGDLGREGKMAELQPLDPRWREIQKMITDTKCTGPTCKCRGRTIDAKRIWSVQGLYLGATGMVTGPKEVLFHGCKDGVVHQICKSGFDDRYSSVGSFGKGLYFSPQSCKAWTYAENYLLVCEVALGAPERRLTVTEEDTTLDYNSVLAKGMRSVQCHAGAPFKHEERIIYHSTQGKPAYLVETTETSPGGGI